MATRHGQTAWYQDDYKTQREFERLSRGTNNLETRLGNLEMKTSGGGSSTTDTAPYPTPSISTTHIVYEKTGLVYVNRLPLTGPITGVPTSELWKWSYNGYANAYGKYVYGVINHNLGLRKVITIQEHDFYYYLDFADEREIDTGGDISSSGYEITFTDLHASDIHGLDPLDAALYKARMQTQVFNVEAEPLNDNRIIVRGVFKPDLHAYYGTMLSQTYDTFNIYDEDNREITCVRTNLIFRWTMRAYVKKELYNIKQE